MSMTAAQRSALKHLRAAYVGPDGGDEEVVFNLPDRQYAVGMLFPPAPFGPPTTEPASTAGIADDDVEADVPRGEVEEGAASAPLAEDWRPSSVAISFVTDQSTVLCDFSGGTYEPIADDGPPRWRRRPFSFKGLEARSEARPACTPGGRRRVRDRLEVASPRRRPSGDGPRTRTVGVAGQ